MIEQHACESGSCAGYWYYSAHLDQIAPGLKQGDSIQAGALIGTVGNTGNAINTFPHIHFSVYKDGVYSNGRHMPILFFFFFFFFFLRRKDRRVPVLLVRVAGIDPFPLLQASQVLACSPKYRY